MTESTFTFIVTEACQLKCKYCYLIGKNNAHKMSFDIARKAIDYIFSESYLQNVDKAVFDFIGGEPLLEIKLISDIVDYIVDYLSSHKHKWVLTYEIRITTNGLLYNNSEVQNFIERYKDHLSISISIDGNKEKNDENRIYSNGKGSYNDIIENVHLWMNQFPNEGTKMTISHNDVPYVYESLKYLIDLGIKKIDVNPVVEDVWVDGDEKIFQEQMIRFADFIIENDLWKELDISVFDDFIGHSLPAEQKLSPCGTMKFSIDSEGKIFPCIRYANYSLRSKSARTIGDISMGLNKNKMRVMDSFFNNIASPTKCLNCEIASECKWCPAESYDSSESGSVFVRTTYACEMHKAKVRVKNYYFNKLKTIGVYYDRSLVSR